MLIPCIPSLALCSDWLFSFQNAAAEPPRHRIHLRRNGASECIAHPMMVIQTWTADLGSQSFIVRRPLLSPCPWEQGKLAQYSARTSSHFYCHLSLNIVPPSLLLFPCFMQRKPLNSEDFSIYRTRTTISGYRHSKIENLN